MQSNRPKKSNPKPQIQLKSLFWTTLTETQLTGTIWDVVNQKKDDEDEEGTINPMEILLIPKPIDDRTITIDQTKLEAMFAKATNNKKTTTTTTTTGSTSKKGPVTLVDGKRQQNVGISLSRFSQRGLSSSEIARALLHCDENVLNADVLNSMLKIMPTKEEIDMCTSYDGPITALGKVEQFFAHLAIVPFCELRVEAMLAKMNLEDQNDEVKLRLQSHETASKQVRRSLKDDPKQGWLRKTLQMVLKVGNYVNGGTRRGGAYGIKLESIAKMASVKTSNNKSNLIQYCTMEMEKLYGSNVIELLKEELIGMEDASKAPLEEIKSGIAKLSKGIQLITSCVEKNLSKEIEEENENAEEKDKQKDQKDQKVQRDEINSQSVDRCFTNFLTYAEGVRDGLSTRHKSVEEEGERIVQLFAENVTKTSSAEVYNTLFATVKLFEKSTAANKRDVEKQLKAEKRANKISKAEAVKAARVSAGSGGSGGGGGGGMFEAHDLFQSGGANDIVARVRKRNMARQASGGDSEEEEGGEESGFRPPPPPKPPPRLANRGV